MGVGTGGVCKEVSVQGGECACEHSVVCAQGWGTGGECAKG